MGAASHGVGEILDQLRTTAEGGGDVVDAPEDRGHRPPLFVPALIDISPVGGIPTLPTLLALIVALVAVQIVLGRTTMWLPFATTVPMAAIASFGLAMTLQDGLLMALGFLISAATVVVEFGLIGG